MPSLEINATQPWLLSQSDSVTERRLSVVEELESVVIANLQRAARLRQSILQKAFTEVLNEYLELGNNPKTHFRET